jgi:hypothetical protein
MMAHHRLYMLDEAFQVCDMALPVLSFAVLLLFLTAAGLRLCLKVSPVLCCLAPFAVNLFW